MAIYIRPRQPRRIAVDGMRVKSEFADLLIGWYAGEPYKQFGSVGFDCWEKKGTLATGHATGYSKFGPAYRSTSYSVENRWIAPITLNPHSTNLNWPKELTVLAAVKAAGISGIKYPAVFSLARTGELAGGFILSLECDGGGTYHWFRAANIVTGVGTSGYGAAGIRDLWAGGDNLVFVGRWGAFASGNKYLRLDWSKNGVPQIAYQGSHPYNWQDSDMVLSVGGYYRSSAWRTSEHSTTFALAWPRVLPQAESAVLNIDPRSAFEMLRTYFLPAAGGGAQSASVTAGITAGGTFSGTGTAAAA